MSDGEAISGAVGPLPDAGPAPRQREKGGAGLRDVLAVGALVGVICWGAWVTRSLVQADRAEDRLVKLQLQGVIAEYLQAQARSGNDERSAAQATRLFMGELDRTVVELGQSGRVVLVNEAVIGGDIPDVTAAVKKAVYARVAMPNAAPAATVRENMQSLMAPGGVRDGHK